MTWARFEDTFTSHPKVLKAGGDAAWLFVCAVIHCNRHLTDGVVDRAIVPALSDRKRPLELAARLEAVGLFDPHPDGWTVHDYHEYQASRAKVEAQRSAARDRMSRARSQRVRANSDGTSDEVRLTPSHPIPSQEEDVRSATAPPLPEGFDVWWDLWPKHPRKQNRKGCEAKWAKLTIEQRDQAIASMPAWCAYWARQNYEFTPLPATWLNQERWSQPPGEGTLGITDAVPAHRSMRTDGLRD